MKSYNEYIQVITTDQDLLSDRFAFYAFFLG
jgi:hypothetical protein